MSGWYLRAAVQLDDLGWRQRWYSSEKIHYSVITPLRSKALNPNQKIQRSKKSKDY